jgi:SGNH hydrolase-like domain, acetyltransferase AlgX
VSSAAPVSDPLEAVAPAGGLEGRAEGVIDGCVVGWAWNPEQPSAHLRVRVVVDGQPVAEGFAGLERPDLTAAGIGDGCHAFHIVLPTELADGLGHAIEVLVGPDLQTLVPSGEFMSITGAQSHPFAQTAFASITQPALPDDPSPQRALIGKLGTLFLCKDRNLTLEQLSGARRLSEEDIEAHVNALAVRQESMRELGVPYVFAVVPMKERVYAELLPDGLSASDTERTPAQLTRALRDVDGCELLDLLAPLRDARRHGRIYHLTDTHWNDRGAFFGTRALLKEAAKRVAGVRPPCAADLRLTRRSDFHGDLADKPKVALVGGDLLPCAEQGSSWGEEIDAIDPRRLRARRRQPDEHLHVSATRPPQLFELPDGPHLPRCVLVGDSFSLMLLPWLAECFSRLAFMWTPEPPLEAVAAEFADLVLHVKAERFLIARPGTLPASTVS